VTDSIDGVIFKVGNTGGQEYTQGLNTQTATAEAEERISIGRIEFVARRRVTQEDTVWCVGLALRVPNMEPPGGDVLRWVVDGIEVDNPIGMDTDRLEVRVRLFEDAPR
jgi:hypothetical protein